MKYALAFLTSPRQQVTAARTLASFERMVVPRPSTLLCVVDGPTAAPPLLYGRQAWSVINHARSQGFCRATGALWKLAAKSRVPWVFWLEDDFVFTRRVDLRDLAHVMQSEPQVAQMALMRQPVSVNEIAAGGYVQLEPGAYTARGLASSKAWIEHQHHWTTNPSLLSTWVPAHCAWPPGPECEGKFGITFKETFPERTFGIWGNGEQWITHIGAREGEGY